MGTRVAGKGIVVAMAAAVVLIPLGARGQSDDCADFATQEEAQEFFESHGGSATNDPFGFDPDEDGIACETLPSAQQATPDPTPEPTRRPRETADPTPQPVRTPETPATPQAPESDGGGGVERDERRRLPVNGAQAALYGGSGGALLALGFGFRDLARRRLKRKLRGEPAPWGDDPLIGW